MNQGKLIMQNRGGEILCDLDSVLLSILVLGSQRQSF